MPAISISSPRDVSVVNTTDFMRKELDILGSRNALRVFPVVIKTLAQHGKPFSGLISRVQRLGGCVASHFTKILIDLEA